MTRGLLVLLLASLIAGVALADSPQTGTIDGTVVDASGAALPGVTVTLGSDRGDKTAVTDESGKFLFGLLPPGQYTLSASLEGFDSTENGHRRSRPDSARASTCGSGSAPPKRSPWSPRRPWSTSTR